MAIELPTFWTFSNESVWSASHIDRELPVINDYDVGLCLQLVWILWEEMEPQFVRHLYCLSIKANWLSVILTWRFHIWIKKISEVNNGHSLWGMFNSNSYSKWMLGNRRVDGGFSKSLVRITPTVNHNPWALVTGFMFPIGVIWIQWS